jgi:hypothetical protein
MSKRHQASRRRTYGRRQHEIHERTERYAGLLGWVDESNSAIGGTRSFPAGPRPVSGCSCGASADGRL